MTFASNRVRLFTALMIVFALALAACSSPAPTSTPSNALNIPAISNSYPAATQAGSEAPTQGAYPAPGAQAATQPASSAYPAANPAGGLQVTLANGSSVTLSAADLQALPAAQVSLNGSTLSGPKLLDVLQKAGVSDFQNVTLKSSASSVTLTKDQVSADTILAVSTDGSLSLAAPGLAQDQQVSGITAVQVQ
jgi:hypothetical protein